MMASRPLTESGARFVTVRLSQVPVQKRLAAADRIIRSEKLPFFEALELRLAAAHPRTDPKIRVTMALAHKVMHG